MPAARPNTASRDATFSDVWARAWGPRPGWADSARWFDPPPQANWRPTASACLVVFLAGGSSQLETWDPKPKTETGGPFRAIPTTVPGVHISELLPKTALQMHRLALIRSINTNENDHGKGRYMMETGRPQSPAADYPHLGAVTAKALTSPDAALPGHVHVSARGGGSRRNDAAYLGPQFGSIVVGAEGGGLRNSERPKSIDAQHDERRQAFRRQINDHFFGRRRTAEMDAYTQSYEQALQLMERRDVFDVSKEPASMLEKYGDHDLGRQMLLGRRLLERRDYVRPSFALELRHAQRKLQFPPGTIGGIRSIVRRPH